jgi:hypothetical protein
VLYKTIKLGAAQPLNKESVMFPEGTKFVYDGKLGIVVAEEQADNAEMRRIRYDDGTEEVVMLSTLVKDSESKAFQIIKESQNEDDRTGDTT